ncbi:MULTISPECIES: PH domain-containing protein [unclassified Alteromonas]|uniref:PH domain-containing protein n=1 Tax=unclassified Alteromonas TaxID=2614992 RepID=UPI000509D0F7|nr:MULTISPECIES: PH domain-containing protein [unclassified Alteromonas]
MEEQEITSSNAGSSVKVETGDAWQRLAIIAILYFSARNIKNSAQGLIYIIPALAIGSNVLSKLNSPEAYIAIGTLVSLAVGSGLISFFMYTFRVHNQHVEIQTGVFQRRYTNLPFWRIQNVKIEHPFYYRPFGYALVVLDTAGSGKEEANIVAVPVSYANALRKQVLAENKKEEYSAALSSSNLNDSSVQSPAQSSPEHLSSDNGAARFGELAGGMPERNKLEGDSVESDEEVLNTRSIGDIVIHGITNNRVWIILGAAAPFYDDAIGLVSDWLADKGLQLNQIVGEQTVAWWQFGLYAFVILMMIMAAMALLSVGGALFTFYGYTLSRSEDRYIRRSGLLNKQEVSMRASRIQMITAKQDWLDKILKRVNLYFEQNSTAGQQVQELMSPNKLIVPSVTEQEAVELSQEVMPDCQLHRDDYLGISKRFILHWLVVAWSVPILALFIVGIVSSQLDIFLGSIGLLVAGSLLLTLRWWRWGIAADGKYVYVRRGRIGVDYLCFEPYKIQQVIVKQSVFMRRHQLASIKFVLASGSVTVPFLPEHYVKALADSVLYEVESTRKSWM